MTQGDQATSERPYQGTEAGRRQLLGLIDTLIPHQRCSTDLSADQQGGEKQSELIKIVASRSF